VRRRITDAIVGVTALVLLVLGLPLAIAVHRSILTSEVVELQANAARALTEVNIPLDAGQLAGISREPDAPEPFSVYGLDGTRIFGGGPAAADSATRKALTGVQASATGGEIIVATPISDDTDERVVGALRLTESLAETNHRSRVAWVVMATVALAALALAWLIARRVAGRLSQPVTELAAAAARIGNGGGTVERIKPSGIEEIDTLATALSDSLERVNEALARERRFSSDVSHQLRTPLTSLRLRLESARSGDDPDLIAGALGDLVRIEGTVEHLLAFARDAMPTTSTVQLDDCARQAGDRWRDRASARGRELSVTTSEPIATRGSATSVAQILDVLIDNALQHGDGHIDITQRRIAGGGAVDVLDHGHKVAPAEVERIFERGHGDDHGIGLALARSIAEAEGGRLLLTRLQPTTFSLILLHPEHNEA
jgi:signal transduction histidine kinase